MSGRQVSHKQLKSTRNSTLYNLGLVSPEPPTMNDYLNPITEIRQIKRLKFDIESPRFQDACKRLQIDQSDLKKKKLADFEAIVRNDRPEDESNPALIRELASIKYNYYLTTFKEVFNDVLDERRRIAKDQRTRLINAMTSFDPSTHPMQAYDGQVFGSGRSSMVADTRMRPSGLNKSVSHTNIKPDRFGPSKSMRDLSSSIITSSSVANIPTKVVALTGNDQKQIDQMRLRNERFTNKLIQD